MSRSFVMLRAKKLLKSANVSESYFLKNTSNLSKAHVTRDSSGPTTWAIVNSMQ